MRDGSIKAFMVQTLAVLSFRDTPVVVVRNVTRAKKSPSRRKARLS